MSYSLKCSESFDSAHYLKGHDGKCKNLHGHRWTVEFGIVADDVLQEGSSRGMVVDFTDIKKAAKAYFDEFDHTLLVEQGTYSDAEQDFLTAAACMGFSIVTVPCRTTAENMSKFFYFDLQNQFDLVLENWGFEIDYVTVYETPNNSATYREV